MNNDLPEFLETIADRSDDELLQIVLVESKQYRPEVIERAEAELACRRIQLIMPAKPAIPYKEAWKDYYRQWDMSVYCGLIPYPCAILLIVLSVRLEVPFLAVFAILTYCIILGVPLCRVTNWKCPRCGKHFFSKWGIHNPFWSECVHCRLSKVARSELGPD